MFERVRYTASPKRTPSVGRVTRGPTRSGGRGVTSTYSDPFAAAVCGRFCVAIIIITTIRPVVGRVGYYLCVNVPYNKRKIYFRDRRLSVGCSADGVWWRKGRVGGGLRKSRCRSRTVTITTTVCVRTYVRIIITIRRHGRPRAMRFFRWSLTRDFTGNSVVVFGGFFPSLLSYPLARRNRKASACFFLFIFFSKPIRTYTVKPVYERLVRVCEGKLSPHARRNAASDWTNKYQTMVKQFHVYKKKMRWISRWFEPLHGSTSITYVRGYRIYLFPEAQNVLIRLWHEARNEYVTIYYASDVCVCVCCTHFEHLPAQKVFLDGQQPKRRKRGKKD